LRQLDEGSKGRTCHQDRDLAETLSGEATQNNVTQMLGCETERTEILLLEFGSAADFLDDLVWKIHKSERSRRVARQIS
jgi:hypothetical protein